MGMLLLLLIFLLAKKAVQGAEKMQSISMRGADIDWRG
jgi:hypothetical protein